MTRSLRNIFDEGNNNKLNAAVQQSRLGTLLSLVPRYVRAPVASNVLVLPDNAKALGLLHVRAIAGSTTGRLNVDDNGGTPASGAATISAPGNVLFAAADAVTEAEILYVPAEGKVWEDVISVASNSGTLNASRKALVVLEVERLAGTDTGAATVVERGASPSDNEAAASLDGATISFNAADAVTSARVKYVAQPGQGTSEVAVGTNLDAADKQY